MEQKLSMCRLCLKDKVICKSHIYPEYMYQNCYFNNHTYIEFNADKKLSNKKRRQGLYEKLFCRECENIFSRYENYAKALLYDEIKPAMRVSKTHYRTNNYDYKKFKLFILSLLWRASISSLDSFKLANLGKYEKELRIILLEGLNTEINNYPCWLRQTYTSCGLTDGVIMEIHPGKEKINGRTVYQFIADGLWINIGVGVCTLRAFPKSLIVSPENLQIAYYEITKIDQFVKIFSRLEQQGKFSEYEKKYSK